MSRDSDPFDLGPEDRDDRDEPEGADFRIEKVLQESPKALQVVLEDTGDIKWVPKSVIHTNSEVYKMGDTGKLVIFMWFAEQEKWL